MDAFEGLAAGELEGSEYRRVKTEVILLNKPYGAVEAWVWEWKGQVDPARKIPSGDWMDVERPPQNPDFTLLGAGALPVFLVAATGVEWVKERVVSNPEASHLGAALFCLILFYATPLLGIMAARVGEKRRERWRLLRWLSCVACTLGLIAGFLMIGVSPR